MKRLCCCNDKKSGLILAATIWLLVFQNPLEGMWRPFSYLDELVALAGVFIGGYEIILVRKCRVTKELLWVGIPLCVFVIAGLAGNLIHKYQPLTAVVIDLYTNLKFFFAIGTGYYWFRNMDWDCMRRGASSQARMITGFLFLVFLADRFFNLYPAEVRYGLQSAMLFYSHPTYFAGATAFLLCLLAMFFEKKNYPFLLACVVMMMFTLRSKAIASAALFIVLFFFSKILNREIKYWHVAALGLAAIILGLPQIKYYFVKLSGNSARSVLLVTAFRIMVDYFPLGTGFGTYASNAAEKWYSPVYRKYGFNDNMELRDIHDYENTLRLIEKYKEQFHTSGPVNQSVFLNDTFWPIIFGQTGVVGMIAYLSALIVLFKKCWKLQSKHICAYIAVIYIWGHLAICSMAEPAFNNATAVPLALLIGIALCAMERDKFHVEQKRGNLYSNIF